MSKWILLLTPLLFACVKSTPSGQSLSVDGSDASIVGGTLVSTPHLPVFLLQGVEVDPQTQEKKLSSCTAVMISSQAALTAAHCVSGMSNLTALFGPHPLPAPQHPLTIAAEDIVIHPDFSPTASIGNDLAIIHFKVLPAGIAVVTLPWQSSQLPALLQANPKLPFRAYGYGDLGKPAGQVVTGENLLRSVDLQIASYTPANDSFLVNQTNSKGICTGDSGGPALVTTATDPNGVLIGIASQVFMDPKEDPKTQDACKFLSIYTNVAYYQSWIESVLQK